MRRAFLPTLLLLCLVGCEALFQSSPVPDQPTWAERPSGSLNVVYTTPLVAQSRRMGEPYERGKPAIDREGGRVFVGSSDGGLYCLDARDGSALWRFQTMGAVQSEPLFHPATNSVFFGAADGALYRVDARNGELRFRFASNSEIAHRPIVIGDTLYTINANDTILALSLLTGKLLWTQHRTPATGMEIAGHSGLLVTQDRVFAGFSDGMVMSYDRLTGHERWQPVDLAAEAEQNLGDIPPYLDVDTTPVPGTIDDVPVLFVGSIVGGVFALEREAGTQLWNNPGILGVQSLLLLDQPRAPGSQGGRRRLLIAASGTTGLFGIDPDSGATEWRSPLPAGGVTSMSLVAGALLVSASQLGVYLVSPLDGRVIDGLHVVDGVAGAAATSGNRAFVMTNGGRLLSLVVTDPRGRDKTPTTEIWGRGYDGGHIF